ncbi:flavodoxin family protein [Methanosarcina sp.]|uniref:flavodoxin family protein n=1 Tax=Methanosarcina sp. TaxID=2213 RepID=UPI002ABB7C0E|nr:flavodoxin family protein [Methanosarcina sp.]MDY9925168.1 flavodoxin family protein [Methanosarcina sp.]
MKIVGISSSPRGKNSNTLKLLDAALEGASEAGAEVESINVAKLDIKYCIACDKCHKKGECSINDDFPALLEKLLAADGIIWSSPNYITNVTAQLKTVFDRCPLVIHEQLFEGKYSMSLTTAGGDELDFILDIMNNFMIQCGGKSIGGVGCSMYLGPEAVEAAIEKSRGIGKDLVEAIKEKRQYSEQEARQQAWKEGFKHSVLANKERWAHNCDYWMEKGWIKE